MPSFHEADTIISLFCSLAAWCSILLFILLQRRGLLLHFQLSCSQCGFRFIDGRKVKLPCRLMLSFKRVVPSNRTISLTYDGTKTSSSLVRYCSKTDKSLKLQFQRPSPQLWAVSEQMLMTKASLWSTFEVLLGDLNLLKSFLEFCNVSYFFKVSLMFGENSREVQSEKTKIILGWKWRHH